MPSPTQSLQPVPRLLLNPLLWLITTILWYATLFYLSGKSSPGPEVAFTIPHFDKVLHFGYFAIGGILLTTLILLKKGPSAPILLRYILPIVLLSILGALDEYRQTFTPGRSGNDLGDWIADTLGGAFGTLLANLLHPVFISLTSRPFSSSKKNAQ